MAFTTAYIPGVPTTSLALLGIFSIFPVIIDSITGIASKLSESFHLPQLLSRPRFWVWIALLG
jgi:hypothetical protein